MIAHRTGPLLLTILLLGSIAAPADVTRPWDVVRGVPNDGDWPANEAPALAIDDEVDTKFLHFKGETQATGLQVTLSAGAAAVTGLVLTTGNDAPERDPVAFVLSGSNVSIDGPYTPIAGGAIVDFAQPSAWPRLTRNATPITFANTTAYAHYQLLFMQVRDAARANSMQIAEVEFVDGQSEVAPPPLDPGEPEEPVDGSSLVISEFKAINEAGQSTRVEGKIVYPDWIEVHNRGTAAASLLGWHLTDDPENLTKWAMPAIQILPGGYLVIFASGIEEQDHPENRPYRDQAGYYHTNFTLDGDGEYLALVSPDFQVVQEYGSRADGYGFPPQRVDLSYGLYGNEPQYFSTPTPGRANNPGYAEVSANPVFSREAGTFTGFFLLELSTANPAAEIRYTIDGQTPTLASLKYAGPIPVAGTREITACAYEPGKAPSAVVSRTYIALAGDVLGFSSNLPIVIVDTARQGIGTNLARVESVIIDTNGQGRTKITDPPAFYSRGGIKRRGSSTAGVAKPSYGFEVWDENNQDRDVSLLGMPAESDWILYAPFNFDRALINNAFMFDLSNRIGRYAVRTRFVEMYLNANDDTVSAADYVGLYILMEKIKRGKNRVDVERLDPWDSTEPKISGGYMLKVDRTDPGDSGFRTARGNPGQGGGVLCYVDPKESEITAAQSAWIRSYLNAFEGVLYGQGFTDPQTGYARYIDVASWIDHNLLNMLAMNVDALRLSTYMFKSREGKIEMGPLWDFDRALDSTDGRDNNAQSWHGTGDGTDYHKYAWWNRLFEDSNFWQKYIDRWYALRQGPFSTASLNAAIDGMADEIREAQVRNFQRWSGQGPRFGGFQGEIDHLKQWLETRCTWVDSQFVAPPRILPEGGRIQAGSTVSLVNPHATGVLYYTLDGSDPRPPGAAPSSLETTMLVPENAVKRVLVPAGPIDEAWRSEQDFDDSAWTAGAGGVGFERGSGYEPLFKIDVGAPMYGRASSCCIRIPFTVSANPRIFNILALNVRYDDGFIAYLNGVEIGRAAFAGEPAWNSSANGNHDDSAAVVFEAFDISARLELLKRGRNLLAIQGLNSSSTSSDFLISCELIAGQGSLPSENGLSEGVHQYTGPIPITESMQIKARVLTPSNPYSPWSGLARAIFDVGPTVENIRINEIMYNPAGPADAEYVELLNTGDSPITLYDAIRGLPWRFCDKPEDPGIDFAFPADPPATLAAGECLLLVKDSAVFHATYNVPAGVQVFEWGDGKLANSGDTIRVLSPGDENLDGARTWILADSVAYDDSPPWPIEADGQGLSLNRIDPKADGNDPADWEASLPSPGVAR